MNNQTLAHTWANKLKEKGSANNMFFENDIIYSYGYHFPIAKHYEKLILFTSESYSNTTAKHKSYVWSAIPYSINKICVPCVIVDNKKEHEKNIQYFIDEIKEHFKKGINAKIHFNFHKARITQYKENLLSYCKYFKIRKNKKINEALKIDFTGEQIKAGKERQKKESKKKREENKREKLQFEIEKRQYIREFKNFKRDNIPYRYLNNTDPVLLRKNNNIIETSKGVKVSLKLAKKFYDRLLKNENIEGEKIQSFTINKIEKNIITIGCHKISKENLKEIFA